MTTRVLAVLLCTVLVSCSGINNRKDAVTENDSLYLRLGMPGDSLEIFMPGVVSCPGTNDASLTISPSGDEIFFARGIWPDTRIFTLRWDGSAWLGPDTADFSKNCLATEPSFSPDGRYVYYSSSLGKTDSSDYCICRVSRKGNGWSEPEQLFDIGRDTIWEFHPSVTAENRLYFCTYSAATASGKIYYSGLSDGRFAEPVPAEKDLNSDFSDVNPYINPAGGFVIFSSNRQGGKGNYDQYISFRNSTGGWDEPQNMGDAYNTDKDDSDIDLTFDGKFIFVYREGDIFWRLSEQFLNRNN